MTEHHQTDLSDGEGFRNLSDGIQKLQSLANDIGIQTEGKQSCIFQEECDKSRIDENEEENLKIIKQTSELGRLAMVLISRSLILSATHASSKSKYFDSFSSAISYLRTQEGRYKVPKHLLLEWERNMILMDLYINNKGLYCSKRIAQDMFDICMETFGWLRSFSNNNK